MGAVRRCAAGVLLALAGVLLVGCTTAPQDGHSATHPAESPNTEPSPSQTPEPEPVLDPDGSAEDNLPYFDFVNAALLEGGNPGGREIIDNLVAAGFDKSAMEVTADRTPLGRDVDSVQFSVRIGEDCLLGQAGAGGYTGAVVPVLQTGSCLIGKTRAIDW